MPKVSKLGNKHRIRFKVYFPDGSRYERSRLVNSARMAKTRMEVATRIEAQTAGQTYSREDVILWHNARLISRADRARLEEDLPGGGKTLAECMDEWESTWSVGADEADSRYFRRKNILQILENKPIRDLTFTNGLELVNELKARAKKVAYIRKHVRDLKAAFNHQVAIRYLEYNPFATLSAGRIPAEEKITPAILTDALVRDVLDKAQEKDQDGRPQLGGTLALHLLMFFGLGIRRKEAMGCKWEHINWQAHSITLPPEITKTKQPRTIGLGARLFEELRKRYIKRKAQSDYILPRFTPRSITRAISKHLRECGIPARLHDARHTYTTMLQDLGVSPHDAMQRTGHADMKMLSHYSHGDFDEVYEDNFGFLKDENRKKRRKSKQTHKSTRS